MNQSNRHSLSNNDHIQQLRREVEKLKRELHVTQESHRKKMQQLIDEEQEIRNENLRLQRKLQLEVCFSLLLLKKSLIYFFILFFFMNIFFLYLG